MRVEVVRGVFVYLRLHFFRILSTSDIFSYLGGMKTLGVANLQKRWPQEHKKMSVCSCKVGSTLGVIEASAPAILAFPGESLRSNLGRLQVTREEERGLALWLSEPARKSSLG